MRPYDACSGDGKVLCDCEPKLLKDEADTDAVIPEEGLLCNPKAFDRLHLLLVGVWLAALEVL